MNSGPHPYHPPGPPKGRNGGCLYGVIGGIATLLLLASCGAIAASRNTSAPAATPDALPAASPPLQAGVEAEKPKKVTNGFGHEYRDRKLAYTATR